MNNQIVVPGTVIHQRNAFDPLKDRQCHMLDQVMTVRDWLDGRGIVEFDQPTYCEFNGVPILRAGWRYAEIKPGDIVAFKALPHGGGGGGGGKNPLKAVMAVVIMVAAAYTGGIAAGAMGFVEGTAGFAAASAGVTAAVAGVGNALMNVLVPLPKANASLGQARSNPLESSPTYALSSQGNTARPDQVIPCQFGRHILFPDKIANAWSYYEDDQQYLCQAVCLGVGQYDVEQKLLGTSQITSFPEITDLLVEPGETCSLFDVNVFQVDEVAGQPLIGTNEQDGAEYLGPFTLNPAETAASRVAVDVSTSRGLGYGNDGGGLDNLTINWQVEARPIDEDGIATGDWVVLGAESLTGATADIWRRSYEYDLPSPGRYEVQARRTNTRDLSFRANHVLTWIGLRAFLDGPDSFEDVTVWMVKARATDSLSSRTSNQLNVIQTRKLPVWNAETGWSEPVATRSIVWAFCEAARAEYGGDLDDARLPLDQLLALDAEFEARGDHFDAVFDSKTTVWDALQRIARCGRAAPVPIGGVVHLVRDRPQTMPTAMFGPRNIVKGSFSVSYAMPSEETADSVKLKFFSEKTWRWKTVTGAVAGSTASKPAQVTLFGVTDQAHAQREADAIAASNRFRRRTAKLETEMDGMIPIYGDLIMLSHDVPEWGAGGEATDWDEANSILTLSEPLAFVDGQTHYIWLRRNDGSVSGPWEVEAGASSSQVQVMEELDFTPYTGSEKERSYFCFGPAEKWGQLAVLRYARPRRGGERVELSLVVEDARAHPN